MLKKFLIFLGAALIFFGFGLLSNGLLVINQDGVYTEFKEGGGVCVYENNEKPLLDRTNGYTRLDVDGGETEANRGVKDLSAKILWSEKVGDITIMYCYSPFLPKYETVHDKKVNVMVAISGGKVSFGYPLLKGSY